MPVEKIGNDRHRTQMSEGRLAWTTINRREFIIYKDDDVNQPDLETIWFQLRPHTSRFCLTAMTTEELAVLKELFLSAFELAEPICAELDKRARADYEKGNDVHIRLYRPPAILFRRGNANLPEPSNSERSESGDDPRVSERSPGLP